MANQSSPSDPIEPERDPEDQPTGGDEKPQVFAVSRGDKEHRFSRRGFLELAGVAAAGVALTGVNSQAQAQGGTKTPTATPTPLPCTVRTTKKTVKVYVGPGRNRGVRQFLLPDQDYPVIGQAKAGDNSLWWKLKIKDVPQAWVAEQDVTKSGDCQNVTGAEIPPVVIAATRAPTGAPTPPGVPGSVAPGQTGINYSVGGTTYTLPCGSPIPRGATCVCNCVTVPAPCSCNGRCSCDGASHYWYPN